MNALNLIKEGLVKGDLQMIAKGYKQITGEVVKPGISQYEQMILQIKDIIKDVGGRQLETTIVPEYYVEGETEEEITQSEKKEQPIKSNGSIQVGKYDPEQNDIVPNKPKKQRKRKKKKLEILAVDEVK